MSTLGIEELVIAVVEPSAVQAQIICNHLKNVPVKDVQSYGNAAEALEQIRQAPPDLVVSAMYLPDMTGAELVQAMRQDARLESLPFMLISSESSFAMLDPIRQAGVIAILPKPFEVKDLVKALHATVEMVAPDESLLEDIPLDDLAILVVDDSSMARKHITRVLQNLGIDNITTASDGSEAVALIEKNFYDLVVTDYNMPEMDGEKLTRFIREHSSQGSVPILMVSSESDESRLSAVQQAGVSGICDKPFDPITVKHMIRSMLE